MVICGKLLELKLGGHLFELTGDGGDFAAIVNWCLLHGQILTQRKGRVICIIDLLDLLDFLVAPLPL